MDINKYYCKKCLTKDNLYIRPDGKAREYICKPCRSKKTLEYINKNKCDIDFNPILKQIPINGRGNQTHLNILKDWVYDSINKRKDPKCTGLICPISKKEEIEIKEGITLAGNKEVNDKPIYEVDKNFQKYIHKYLNNYNRYR